MTIIQDDNVGELWHGALFSPLTLWLFCAWWMLLLAVILFKSLRWRIKVSAATGVSFLALGLLGNSLGSAAVAVEAAAIRSLSLTATWVGAIMVTHAGIRLI